MKAPNAVGIFLWIYTRTKIMEMSKANFRKTNTNTNTEIYGKNPKGKNHGERFLYDNGDYNGISLVC